MHYGFGFGTPLCDVVGAALPRFSLKAGNTAFVAASASCCWSHQVNASWIALAVKLFGKCSPSSQSSGQVGNPWYVLSKPRTQTRPPRRIQANIPLRLFGRTHGIRTRFRKSANSVRANGGISLVRGTEFLPFGQHGVGEVEGPFCNFFPTRLSIK